MLIRVQAFSLDRVTERNMQVYNPPWRVTPSREGLGVDTYAEFGMVGADPRVGPYPGGFSGLSFSFQHRGGFDRLQFQLKQDRQHCELQLNDLVELTVNNQTWKGFVNRLQPTFSSDGEVTDVEVLGFSRYNTLRLTKYDKNPSEFDRDGELYWRDAVGVMDWLRTDVFEKTPHVGGSRLLQLGTINTTGGDVGGFHVAYHQTPWYQVMDQVCDFLDMSVSADDLLLGKSFYWHVANDRTVCVSKANGAQVDYSLGARPFRITRSPYIESYSVDRADINSLENIWYVKSLAKRASKYQCTEIKPGTGINYSDWSINNYGAKEGTLQLSFTRSMATIQKWINRYGKLACVPNETVSLVVRSMADVVLPWSWVNLTIEGIGTTGYKINTVQYEVTSEQDLRATYSLGADRLSLAKRLLEIKNSNYFPLTHNERWGHEDDTTAIDGSTIYNGTDKAENRNMNQPYGGGGGTCFSPWQIVDTKDSIRYGLFFEHTDQTNHNPERAESEPGALTYARQGDGADKTMYTPVMRTRSDGVIEVYTAGRYHPNYALSPTAGLGFFIPESGELQWGINPAGTPSGALKTYIDNSGGDGLVFVTPGDLVKGHLRGKVVQGTGISITDEDVGGGDIVMRIATTAGADDKTVKAVDSDSTPGFLGDKVVAVTGGLVRVTTDAVGVDRKLRVGLDIAALNSNHDGRVPVYRTGAVTWEAPSAGKPDRIEQPNVPTTRLEIDVNGHLLFYVTNSLVMRLDPSVATMGLFVVDASGKKRTRLGYDGRVEVLDASEKKRLRLSSDGSITAYASDGTTTTWSIDANGTAAGIKVGFRQG